MARLYFSIKLSSDDAFKLKVQALNDDPRLKGAGIGALKFSTDKQLIAGGEILSKLPPEPAAPAPPRNKVSLKLSSDYAFKLKAQALNNDPRLIQAGIAALKFDTDKQYIAGGEFHSEVPPPEPANMDLSGNVKGDGGSAKGGKTRISVRVERNTAYALKAEQLNGNPRLKEVGISDFKLKKRQLLDSQPEELSPPLEEQPQSREEPPQSEVQQPQPIKDQAQPRDAQEPRAEVQQPQPIEEQVPKRLPRKSWFRRSVKQSQPIAEQAPLPEIQQKPGIIRRFFKFVTRLIKWGIGLGVVAVLAVAAILNVPGIRSLPVVEPLVGPVESVVESFVAPIRSWLTRNPPAISPTPTGVLQLITVQGQVVDATTGQPLTEAQVCVQNTTQCAGVDGNGSYTLMDVLATEQVLEVTATGYTPVEESIAFGQNLTTTKNFALSPELVEGELRIVLTWGETPTDLDSHLWVPGTEGLFELYYSTKDQGAEDQFPFAVLDTDAQSGYGPETITIKERVSGTYTYAVYNYSDDGTFLAELVQVYGPSGLIAEYTPPTGQEGRWWYVFDMDGDTGAITDVNRLENERPVQP